MKELKQEQYADQSLSYPTFGRGLKPGLNMDTFMIQENMAAKAAAEDKALKEKEKQAKQKGTELSPQPSMQAKQRRKIISPARQNFERVFEAYMKRKYVEQPVKDIDKREAELEILPPFDTVTKT